MCIYVYTYIWLYYWGIMGYVCFITGSLMWEGMDGLGELKLMIIFQLLGMASGSLRLGRILRFALLLITLQVL